MLEDYILFNDCLCLIKKSKVLISTLNAYSYNIACKDLFFREALQESDIVIPDGISVVWAVRLLTGKKLRKIAGEDLFFYEMKRIEQNNGKVFFLGSNEFTLSKIKSRIAREYSNVSVSTYSPPYKLEFTDKDSMSMINAVNNVHPDVLFVGMTAPKQEKWAYKYFSQIKAGHICCIGAVFDFYAGTVKRAPLWMVKCGLEWLYRLIKEPVRMWRRYILGNAEFVFRIFQEKYVINKRR